MKTFLSLAFTLIAIFASAQDDLNKLLFYDQDWKTAKPKKAAFLVEQKYINDTLWEWNYYEAKFPRFLSVQFKDQKGVIMNGKYTTYDADGHIDTLGYVSNGKRHGGWTIFGSNRRVLYHLQYENDVLVARRDSTQYNNDMSASTDSISTATRIFTKVEIESEFPGGLGAWAKYIRTNIRYPQEAFDNNVMGEVVVQFIVDKQGYVTNVELAKSAEYYLDKEALRLISKSPPWTPAVQNGRPVKSYKKQPVNFRFTR